ncbi:MAG TPA: proline--tRNA ligase [Candidatus Faeciplasma pullistercoris]|uniref:Proline--tRNA ligase n=1 Tax=Candidatus Faeciplasma pullistercoris TaxID=2840800 RepID=A0A9D1GUV6_9FIRM|nr:proline--tRNA ligase [Candidatus Faeciplasma pullistercoris]
MSKNDKNEKLVSSITPMSEDFAQWYTDIVKKAELIEYTSVKGCMVIRPYGYAIWENMQRILDTRFKELGHENVCMPMFIPESLLNKEKEHVEGFAPEVAWVTYGGKEKLEERLCVRPTSETLFCEHYANIVHSYRDLPKLYNQWVSVVRWEKTTRPFLRSREFLWQEGHTIHETAEEAIAETERMLGVYADFCEQALAMPVIRGKKTDSDKFAGAVSTYAIEAMMHDGKALQAGTSHYFGDGFAKAFGITFTDRSNTVSVPHQTSWGVSTRLIGAIIMAHGDDNGLVLPPAVAPVQVVVVPIAQHKEGVLEKANELYNTLKAAGIRVKLDDSENSPGWKFAEYEMRGVPLRIEIGPKDIEQNQCVAVERHNRNKTFVPLDKLTDVVKERLQAVHDGMYQKALDNLNSRTYSCTSIDEIKSMLENNGDGFVKAMWCGDEACEDKVKELTGVGSRCIPFEQEQLDDKCVCCGKPAKCMVIWGKAY